MTRGDLLFPELRCNLREYARDQTIYAQGGGADCWYEVIHGTARICHYYPDGRRQIMAFVFPGEVLGLERAGRHNSAEALTSIQLYRHALDDLSLRLDIDGRGEGDHPAIEKALKAARESIALLGLPTAIERVAAFLLSVAHRTHGGPLLYLPMSRADIADYLCLTMHTVSRSMSELARRGLIVLDAPQRVRLLAPEKLAHLAGVELANMFGGEAQLVA